MITVFNIKDKRSFFEHNIHQKNIKYMLYDMKQYFCIPILF